MKNETISQDLIKPTSTACHAVIGQPAVSRLIEKEYINSMLNINCSDLGRENMLDNIDNSEQTGKPVDLSFNKHADVECKVFVTAGLNLALPLFAVKSILKQQEILSGSGSGLHIGTIKSNNEDIKSIDLTSLIMNRENDIEETNKVTGKLVDIILLKGASVGIIYDHELEDQIISHQHVCWRNATSDRLWLAGTVKQKALSLLDLEGILNLLRAPLLILDETD